MIVDLVLAKFLDKPGLGWLLVVELTLAIGEPRPANLSLIYKA
jgi:hypothetical protein